MPPSLPPPSSTSSSAPASTASRPPGTSPRPARRSSSSTRPASPRARPASPAASCATTTSSRRCPSSWPRASRSGSPIPRRCTTTARATSPSARRRRSPTSSRSSSASSASATPRSCTPASARCSGHMCSLYPDWRAPGLTVCLHEHAGGFAFNRESMLGLADKARAAGAQIVEGVEVTGFDSDSSGAVTTVHTSAGDIAVEQVVVAVGPWIASLWEMLGLPATARRPHARRHGRRGAGDVDLLVPAGGRGRGRPGVVHHRRRQAVPGPARRQRCGAARRRADG